MYIFSYLRASTNSQDANRAKSTLQQFANENGVRIAAWYIENISGATLQRPKLMQLLEDAEIGDVLLIEKVDRLSRLNSDDWSTLKAKLFEKRIRVVSLDLPTSHLFLKGALFDDSFTNEVVNIFNGMMLDLLANVARKDYLDRRERQSQGIKTAKQKGKYRGRQADTDKHNLIIKYREENKRTIAETAKIVGVSERTVIRVCNHYRQQKGE